MELSTFNRLEDFTPRVNLGILKIQKNVFLSVIKIPPKSHGVSKSNILQTATSHSTRNLTSENMGPPYQALPTQRCLRPAELECACVLVGPLAPAGVTPPYTPPVSSHQEESTPHLSGRSDQGEGHRAQKQEWRLEIMKGVAMRTLKWTTSAWILSHWERQHGVLHPGLLVAKITAGNAALLW